MTANMFDCSGTNCSISPYEEVRVCAFNRADLESGATLQSIVADLELDATSACCRATCAARRRRRGARTFSSASRRPLTPSRSASSTSTGQRQRLDLHRPDERQPDGLHVLRLSTVPSSGETRSIHAARAHDDAGRSTATSTAPSRSGSTTRSRPRNQFRVRPGSSGRRSTSPAERCTRHRCSSRSTATSEATGSTAGWAASPSTAPGTWRSATASRARVNPDIRYAGRLATDPLNTLPQGEARCSQAARRLAVRHSAAPLHSLGRLQRDDVDPVDDCTFWYTNEYYATSGLNWKTRIGSFKFPSAHRRRTPI